jgi:DNA-binding winged helix-turn-helix (wHTH) protein
MKYFPPFRFDDRAGVLSRSGEVVPLTRKAGDLLKCLLERPGVLVAHSQILERVWPETHVQPDNVKALVHELRAALGDQSEAPRFIRSEPGRGYTFIAAATDAMTPLLSDRPSGRFDLIGRDAELAVFDRHLALAADEGQPQLLIIEGERGFGKTSLCETFAQRAVHRVGLRLSYGQGLEVWGPLEEHAVLLDAFDLLARQHPGSVPSAFAKYAPGWLSRLSQWSDCEPGLDDTREASQLPPGERMFRELAAVLDSLASDAPLLLILEDLQWADAATIECLRIIGRRHMPSRLCVVATYCGSHDLPAVAALERLGRALEPAGACTIIGLAPLTEAQLFRYLHDRFDGDVARAICRPLYRAGGGNPALTVMTVDGLVRLGALRSTPAGWQMSPARDGFETLLAASLADALQCQIDRLPSDDRCILEAAAGVGSEFTADTVASNLGIEPSNVIDRRLMSMARRQVLIDFADLPAYAGGQMTAFRLRHPLIANLLSDRQPDARPLRQPRADAARRPNDTPARRRT